MTYNHTQFDNIIILDYLDNPDTGPINEQIYKTELISSQSMENIHRKDINPFEDSDLDHEKSRNKHGYKIVRRTNIIFRIFGFIQNL